MTKSTLQNFFRSRVYQIAICAVIIINAIVLGCECSSVIKASAHYLLVAVDNACLAIFTLELVAKIYAFGFAFFTGKDKGWNLFDFVIVGLSLFASAGISVLRALRIFRAMRLLSVLPQMRLITEAMLHTLPSLFGVAILLFIFYYVYAVLCVNLFGTDFPAHFGDLGKSFFTLFRLMIMDDFGNIVRQIIDKFAYAWVIFVSFVLIVGFVVLNLVVGIIVESISEIKGKGGVGDL